MLTDLKYAFRQLRRSPGFTLVAVLTLALGIGANTTVFSLLNAALFRKLDAPEPNRLVWLVGTRDGFSRFRALSYPEYLAHRDRDSVFSGVMTYQDMPVALGSGGVPERVDALVVSGNYFSVLGVRPQLGRTFAPEEDATPLAHPVVILSDNLWRRRFGADSAIVGQSIVLNGRSYAVIGVAPAGFNGIDIGQQGALYVPFAMLDHIRPNNGGMLASWNVTWLRAVARLRAGVSLEQARAAVRQAGLEIARANPETMERTSASVEPLAGGLDPNNRREGLPIFALLMAVPAMVLLIACANAANLLLSRATARRREIGVRLALGASRGRLIRMLLAESMMLGIAAAALGMLSSYWLTDLISALGEVPSYITDVVTPDRRVLAFTMLLGLVTGVLFGLAPALGASRAEVTPALKEDGIAGRRVLGSRLRSALVVAQVTVSLVLLIVAGLFLRTLGKATGVETGFDPRNGMTAAFDLALQGYDNERAEAFYRELHDRAEALPGVTSASFASDLPLSNRMVWSEVLREGDVPDPETTRPNSGLRQGFSTGLTTSWPGFLHTMGVALVAGRDFTMQDGPGAPGVVIVNETLARRMWPDESPLGKRLRLDSGEPLLEVVGVARDGRYHELTEQQAGFLYLPERQHPRRFGSDMALVLRTAGDPRPLLATVREVIRGMDRNLPVYRLQTLEEHVRQRLDKERGASALLGAFGSLALLLASLGLYGVMAYAVTQRTREIGIRVALGAARRDVLGMVVGEGVKLAAVGIVIGLVLSAALTRIIGRFLYGVTATDVATFGAVALLLAAVAAGASLIPARRATRVDPMVALRAE